MIAISGPSGSGKSTIAQALTFELPGSIVVQQDWYFRDGDKCPPDANFCELRWLHIDLFVRDLHTLAAGRTAQVPIMDFASFRKVGTRPLGPAWLVIVEGMTIFRVPELAAQFSSRYYVDVDFDILADRKRARDHAERGKPPEVSTLR